MEVAPIESALTSSNAQVGNDTEHSQPSNDASVVEMRRSDDEHERPKYGEAQLFAVDFVSSKGIAEQAEPQLAKDHTELETLVSWCSSMPTLIMLANLQAVSARQRDVLQARQLNDPLRAIILPQDERPVGKYPRRQQCICCPRRIWPSLPL